EDRVGPELGAGLRGDGRRECFGARCVRLLRLSVFAINQGTADLVVGKPDPNELLPDGTPKWVYSACHKHCHFETFAWYELRQRCHPPRPEAPILDRGHQESGA